MFTELEYDEEDYSSIYKVAGLDTCFVNAYRRVIMADIETHAFEEENIEMIMNNSVLHNEIVKHRISLIPVMTAEEGGVSIDIDIVNETKGVINVTTNDVTATNGSVCKDIAITVLKAGERFVMKARSTVGSGSKSSIFKPASGVHFKIMKEVKTDSDEVKEYIKQQYECCEHNGHLLTYGVKLVKVFLKQIKAKFGDDCDIDLVEYSEEGKYVYAFFIESNGQKQPSVLLSESRDILRAKFENVMKKNIEVSIVGQKVELNVGDETATLCHIFAQYLRKNDDITYAVYNKKHPLDDDIFIVLFMKQDTSIFKDVLKTTIKIIVDTIDMIN